MITMEPVLKRGYTFWDQALLPADEFGERVRAVQGEMKKADLAALVIFSNAYHNADVAYLAGLAGGTLLLTTAGDPVLFTGGGGRELPFQRMLTWISDLTSAGGPIGTRLRTALQERSITGGTVGVVGTHVLTAGTYANVLDALSDYHLTDFDVPMRTLRARKRPREVAMVRTALHIATDAAAAAERAFANGATTTQAMVEAERSARVNRARDVRLLANIGGDDLRPFEGLSDARRTPLLLWVGLTYGGYWADVAVTSPAPPDNAAARAVAAMTAAAKAGARPRDVAQAALDVLSPAAAETALAYGLGGGIGLALNDWPPISPTSAEPLPDGALLSLRTLAPDGDRVSFAGAIVQVGAEGGRRIEPL